MIRFFHSGVETTISCDWLGFTVEGYAFEGYEVVDCVGDVSDSAGNVVRREKVGESVLIDPIFDYLPAMKKIPGRFHVYSYRGEGVTINHIAKPGTQNGHFEIELSGKYLMDRGYEPILEYLNLCGARIRPFRCDACLDYYGEVDEQEPIIKRRGGEFTMYHAEDGLFTGYKFGKSDRVVRLYNKGFKEKSKRTWWRYEIALRGDKCRDAFSDEFQVYGSRQIDNILCKILTTTSSCYDDRFRDIALGCVNGEIVFRSVKKGDYTMSERILFDEMEKRVKKFQKRWSKEIKDKYGSTEKFYIDLIRRLDAVLLEKKEQKTL